MVEGTLFCVTCIALAAYEIGCIDSQRPNGKAVAHGIHGRVTVATSRAVTEMSQGSGVMNCKHL